MISTLTTTAWVMHLADKASLKNSAPPSSTHSSLLHLTRISLIAMLPLSIFFVLGVLFLHNPTSVAYDIAIYGATPGGIAAAITAARASSSLKIALIEPTADIGGMSTGGGLGLRDLGWEVTSKLIASFFFFTIPFHFSQWIRCIRLGTQ